MASRGRRESRFLQRLTLFCVIVGELSALSYALGGPIALRSVNPSLGAWWDARQFYLMQGAATALGLLIGIRIGRRFVADARMRSRCVILAFMPAIAGFVPLLHLCGAAARLGWSGSGAATRSRIIDLAGYVSAKQLDNVLIAGVYFFKIVGFALLAGLAFVAVGVVLSQMIGDPRAETAPAEPTIT